MDWSNERYVRIYTRDTITWKRLGWAGQTVLMHVIRKLDRSGVLDLSGVSAIEAVGIITELPMEVIKNGLSKCLELGVFVEDDGRLLMPNHIDAQEAVASNAERQRRWRSKKRSNETSTDSNETSTDSNESNVTRNENNPVPNQPYLTSLTNLTKLPDSSESVRRRIEELESQYDAELIRETRNACALSRKSGRMSDSIWLSVLERLSKHPVDDVVAAARTFVDKHADGEKDERYLLGIVRGQTKKKKKSGGLFDSEPGEEPYFDNELFGKPDGADEFYK